MRVGPTPFWSSLYLEVCPTITKRRPNILLAREINSSSCQMCKKNLPPRGCVLFVIDKIGNFVTIPVHAFGSESEHSTIYVTMFGGRISIGVQSKRIFFFFHRRVGQTIDPIFRVRFRSRGKTASSPGRRTMVPEDNHLPCSINGPRIPPEQLYRGLGTPEDSFLGDTMPTLSGPAHWSGLPIGRAVEIMDGWKRHTMPRAFWELIGSGCITQPVDVSQGIKQHSSLDPTPRSTSTAANVTSIKNHQAYSPPD